MQSQLTRGALVLLALGLAACGEKPAIAPVQPPATPLGWQAPLRAGQTLTADWWRGFNDPGLDQVVAKVLANNADLAIAAARRDQLDSERAIAAAGRWPQIIGHFLASDRDQESAKSNNSKRFRATADVSYELDLWGAAAAAEAGDQARLEAAEADHRAARLSLSAEAARLWLEIAALSEQLSLKQAEIKALESAQSVARAQAAGGWTTAETPAHVESRLLAARRDALNLESAAMAARRDLTVLAGANPGTIAINPKPLSELTLPGIKPDLPATVLAARPDVAAAEARLNAARAGIGEAIAAQYPDFTLTGSIGLASDALKNFLRGPSLTWMVALPVELKLVDGGAGEARISRAQSTATEAEANWRGRIVRALAEVESALADAETTADAEAIAIRRLKLMQQSEAMAGRALSAGTGTKLDTALARADRLEADRGRIETRALRYRAAVELAKALGGGS